MKIYNGILFLHFFASSLFCTDDYFIQKEHAYARMLKKEDEPLLRKLLENSENEKAFEAVFINKATLSQDIEHLVEEIKEGKLYFWMTFSLSHELFGVLGLTNVRSDNNKRHAEFIGCVVPSYQKHNLSYEGSQMMFEYALNHLNIDVITSKSTLYNPVIPKIMNYLKSSLKNVEITSEEKPFLFKLFTISKLQA